MINIPDFDINDELVTKLSAITTEKQLERAWAEYTENIAANYQSFVAYVGQVIDILDIPESYEALVLSATSYQDIENVVSEVIQTLDDIEKPFRDRSSYFLNAGYFIHNDFLRLLIIKYINDSIRTQLPPIEIPDSIDSDYNLQMVNDPSYTLDAILIEINSTWHAVVCDKSLAKAYSMSDDTWSRLSIMRDEIATIFSSSYSDISGYLNDRVNALKQGISLTDIIQNSMIDMGIEDVSNENKDYYNDCLFQEYTGATPTSAYCWDTIGSTIVSSVKVAAKAVRSVFKSIFNIGKKLFSKVVTVAKEIIVDPYDLEEINGEQGNHTIDTMSSYSIFRLSGGMDVPLFQELSKGPLHFDFLTSEYIVDIPTINGTKYAKAIDSNRFSIIENLQWFLNYITDYKFNDTTGNYIMPTNVINLLEEIFPIKFNQYYNHDISIIDNISQVSSFDNLAEFSSSLTQGLLYNILIIVIRKLKPISAQVTATILRNLEYDDNFIHPINSSAVYNYLKNQSNIYNGVSDNEIDLYNGFINSIILEHILLGCLSSDGASRHIITKQTVYAYSTTEEYSRDLASVIQLAKTGLFTYANLQDILNTDGTSYGLWYKNSSVTNADFLYVAAEISGIQEFNITSIANSIFNNTNYDRLQIYNKNFKDVYSFGGDNLASFLGLINAHFNQKQYFPLDYKFIPYNQQNADFEMSSFRIKTNSENINAFNTFITTAILVVAAVALTIVGIKVLRNISTRRMLNANANKVYLQNKLIRGEEISKADLKTLHKNVRKANRMSFLQGNATSATTAITAGSSTEGNFDMAKIISLITGTRD